MENLLGLETLNSLLRYGVDNLHKSENVNVQQENMS